MTQKKYPIVTICGSTKFKEEHLREIKRLTLEGNIVLACPFYNQADGIDPTQEEFELLDALHMGKIDISDSIFVVNPGGYIGDSTRREIVYATKNGKGVEYLEPIE